jgi:hypothetical protein
MFTTLFDVLPLAPTPDCVPPEGLSRIKLDIAVATPPNGVA